MFEEKTLTKLDLELLKELYPNDYEKQIEKVKKGYPVQYLIGNVPFFNSSILVNENVLIPRFETEYLVEKILKKMNLLIEDELSLIDIGTGSGCIAIALNLNTKWKCTGIDFKETILKVAKQNNEKNGTNVTFKKIDILKEPLEEYDIYVSNPPYIDREENYDSSIKYEPDYALFADEKGMIFYKTILQKIKNHPKLIAFEIGETQGKSIYNLAKEKFPEAEITIESDLCGKDRYIFIENKH